MMYRPRRTKYGSRKITVFGITFDSKREAQRYMELSSMQRAGKITDLQTQVHFQLIPALYGDDGKVVQRKCEYVADFVYWRLQEDGSKVKVVEDAKGFPTEAYKIKKKMMRWMHGIEIREV